MIVQDGINLYSATEVSSLIGISRDTLSTFTKKAGVQDRRVARVRYYTEEEIRLVLRSMSDRSSQ